MIPAPPLNLRSTPLAAIGAALIATTPILTMAPEAVAQRRAEEKPAELFKRAVETYRAGDYEASIKLFARLYEMDPNPFSLYNIGRCYEELGQLERAAQFYQRALARGGLPEDARVEAVDRLTAIEALQSDSRMRDRVEAGHLAAKLVINMARVRGLDEARREDEDRRQAALQTPPPPRRGTLTWVGVGAAAAGVLALGAGTAFAMGASDGLNEQETLRRDFNALQDDAIATDDPVQAARALEAADDINTLADDIELNQALSLTMFGAGSALLIGGLVMIVLDNPTAEAQAPAATLRLTPNGVVLDGRW